MIEHRMFCHITQNWRGRPLASHEIIINLIANTATRTGLKIRAELDPGNYPTGIKVTDEELRGGRHDSANSPPFPRLTAAPDPIGTGSGRPAGLRAERPPASSGFGPT